MRTSDTFQARYSGRPRPTIFHIIHIYTLPVCINTDYKKYLLLISVKGNIGNCQERDSLS